MSASSPKIQQKSLENLLTIKKLIPIEEYEIHFRMNASDKNFRNSSSVGDSLVILFGFM